MKKTTMLMILDGYGLNDSDHGNAIAAANTPCLDNIFKTYPNTRIDASGLAVGLPEGQMGNSEVGHLNMGAGRIVYQELTKITKAIDDGPFFDNVALSGAMDHVKNTGGKLHLYGLLSDGGVHSHTKHLKALIEMAKRAGVEKVFVHAFMDGRDVPPTSGLGIITDFEKWMEEFGLGKIGVVSGRYYAMDRDKRWERVVLAYDALTLGQGKTASCGATAVEAAYAAEETDEFIMPTVCCEEGLVDDGDSIVMFNFRPDRAREITRAFVDKDFDGFERKKTIDNLYYVCMTQYDAEMPNVKVAFPPTSMKNTLGEYVASKRLTQLRIAETEKYAHVTFFFNGGVEEPNTAEERILIPSPKVATYDMQPEMSAYQVAEKVVEAVKANTYDMIILNFANADMVGHTGDFDAAVKAIEALDKCVADIVEVMLAADGQILLTADHGNADNMLDDAGNVVTAHSTNQVPLVHISNTPVNSIKDGGKLADIAPTMLKLMGLEVPEEMTGDILI